MNDDVQFPAIFGKKCLSPPESPNFSPKDVAILSNKRCSLPTFKIPTSTENRMQKLKAVLPKRKSFSGFITEENEDSFVANIDAKDDPELIVVFSPGGTRNKNAIVEYQFFAALRLLMLEKVEEMLNTQRRRIYSSKEMNRCAELFCMQEKHVIEGWFSELRKLFSPLPKYHNVYMETICSHIWKSTVEVTQEARLYKLKGVALFLEQKVAAAHKHVLPKMEAKFNLLK